MKSAIYTVIAAMMLLSIATGCRTDKRTDDSKWKPWAETDEEHPLGIDSTDTDSTSALTDTLAADSALEADSAAISDSLQSASPRGSHHVLHGRAGTKDIYLNFSTINGSHLMGNAVIDGRSTEITGTTETSGTREHIVILEPRAMRDSTRFRIEATSTDTGYEGTYTEGTLSHPVTLTP